MSEFKHWLDEASDADDFERAILRSGLGDADPSPTKCDEVWAGITGALALPPLLTSAAARTTKAAAGSASKAVAVWLGIGKGFILGLAVYGAAAGVSEITQRFSARRATRITTSAPSRRLQSARCRKSRRWLRSTAEPAVASVQRQPSPLSQPRPRRLAPTAAARLRSYPAPQVARPIHCRPWRHSTTPASATRASQLQAEAQALRNARAELRSGRLADAFATLEASRRQFSAPELYQEREALMIELLQRSGQVTAARERANAFLSRFPESPHAEQIRRFAAH